MKQNYEQGNSLWKDARRRLLRNRAAMTDYAGLEKDFLKLLARRQKSLNSALPHA